MTLLQYLAQQHRFAKWQIRRLNELPSTDQNDDDLYFFERLADYLQGQRDHHRGIGSVSATITVDPSIAITNADKLVDAMNRRY